MRVPPFHRYRRFSQISAVFVLGMVAGSVLYNSIFHAGYNALWMDNLELRIEIEQYQKDIKTLKKYNNSSTVIREIKLRTESTTDKEGNEAPDTVTEKEIISKMTTDLAPMRGRSMFEIDTDGKLARLLLDGKIYIVRDKEYAVSIRTMLVMEGVLQIWVEIHPNRR